MSRRQFGSGAYQVEGRESVLKKQTFTLKVNHWLIRRSETPKILFQPDTGCEGPIDGRVPYFKPNPLFPGQIYREPECFLAKSLGVFQIDRSEEHTSELQSLMRISYAVFCLKKKTKRNKNLDIQYILSSD